MLEHMFATLEDIEDALQAITADLDPDTFHGSDAQAAMERFAHIERIAHAGARLMAKRVADKAAVLKGVQALLKPSGEFYFSDVYADRRVPAEVRNDPVLYGECLGGALYWGDFLRLAKSNGFADPRLTESRPLEITDPILAARTGALRFFSANYRLFNLAHLETECEDYGQAVIYKGTIKDHPTRLVLDQGHNIETGKVFPVCGNTWMMLHDTRFAPHFEFIGDFSKHYGIFEGCGGGLPFTTTASGSGALACC